jgi:hypothetical protein
MKKNYMLYFFRNKKGDVHKILILPLDMKTLKEYDNCGGVGGRLIL